MYVCIFYYSCNRLQLHIFMLEIAGILLSTHAWFHAKQKSETSGPSQLTGGQKLKDRITPHVKFFQ